MILTKPTGELKIKAPQPPSHLVAEERFTPKNTNPTTPLIWSPYQVDHPMILTNFTS